MPVTACGSALSCLVTAMCEIEVELFGDIRGTKHPGLFAAFTAEQSSLTRASLYNSGLQVESAGVVLMDSITEAFEPLTKTDGSEPEKLRPKLRYNEKNMAVYIVVVKNSQVGHL